MKRFILSVLLVLVLSSVCSAGSYPISSWPALLKPGETVRWEAFSGILLDVINKGIPNQASFTAQTFPLTSLAVQSAGTVVVASTTAGYLGIPAASATNHLGVLIADVAALGTAYIAYGGKADVLVTNGATASYFLLTSDTYPGKCESTNTALDASTAARLVGIAVESVASGATAACEAVIVGGK